MRKNYSIVIMLFVFSLAVSAQVTVSDAFQKTVKKISQERIKNEVIDWITQNDPVTGIIARDLITQVIDNHNDEKTLLKSTANVMTTMLFIGGIKKHLLPIVEQYPDILKQAANVDWDQQKLIAYSALYIYYSERIKRHLYVSKAVMEMKAEKHEIESFMVFDSSKNQNVKWTSIISREFIKLRGTGDNLNLALDVRALEFVQYCFTEILTNEDNAAAKIDSALLSLKASYDMQGDNKFSKAIENLQQTTGAIDVLQTLFEKYISAYKESDNKGMYFVLDKKRLVSSIVIEKTDSVSTSLDNALADPFNSLISSAKYSYVDPSQSKQIITGIARELIENWITKAHQDGWKFEYTFSLAGTMFFGGSKVQMDFTVLDQFRFARHWESSTFYLFAGGIFDPILKNTIYKTPINLYLTGIGYQIGNTSLSLDAGIPYSDFELSNFRFGLSFGYEIPVSDLFD